ncbi:MAG: hypothetical protein ACOYMA_21635 [Bacteroidia bacterium]
MNFTKNIILAFCLTILGISVYADTKPATKKAETTQIQSYLEKIDFKEFISKDTHLIIHFMINDYNEIIVLSTNNEDLDGYLKTSLNDKKIDISKLEYNKEYDLPVVIKLKN